MKYKFIKNRKDYISESKVDIKLPDYIRKLNSIFKEYNYSLYLVGGAVRDFLMNEEPKDFDVATNATSDQVIDIFVDKFGVKSESEGDFILKNKWRINLQGKSYGVVVIYMGVGEGIEIASFSTRQNGEIKLGATLEEDINRRDLTYNALFYDIDDKKIIDLVGGMEDLSNKRIRMVGDPNSRIKEDPIRIQRIFRFATRYGSTIDSETKKAIMDNKHLYRDPTDERPNGVSQERIIDEFIKSFKLKNFDRYIKMMDEFEMWDILFPGIGFSKSDNYKNVKYLSVAIAQLFKDEPNNTFNSLMVREWKFSSKLAIVVKLLVDLYNLYRNNDNDDSSIYKAIDIRSNQLRMNISDKILLEFIKVMNINDKIINRLVSYDPYINSIDVMDELNIDHKSGKLSNPRKDGKRLGDEIRIRKLNSFKSI